MLARHVQLPSGRDPQAPHPDPLILSYQAMTPVLFVHGITEIGGAERGLLRVLERLPRFGYRHVVVCGERGPWLQELTRRSISTPSPPLPAWAKLFAFLSPASTFPPGRQVRAKEGTV